MLSMKHAQTEGFLFLLAKKINCNPEKKGFVDVQNADGDIVQMWCQYIVSEKKNKNGKSVPDYAKHLKRVCWIRKGDMMYRLGGKY